MKYESRKRHLIPSCDVDYWGLKILGFSHTCKMSCIFLRGSGCVAGFCFSDVSWSRVTERKEVKRKRLSIYLSRGNVIQQQTPNAAANNPQTMPGVTCIKPGTAQGSHTDEGPQELKKSKSIVTWGKVILLVSIFLRYYLSACFIFVCYHINVYMQDFAVHAHESSLVCRNEHFDVYPDQ